MKVGQYVLGTTGLGVVGAAAGLSVAVAESTGGEPDVDFGRLTGVGAGIGAGVGATVMLPFMIKGLKNYSVNNFTKTFTQQQQQNMGPHTKNLIQNMNIATPGATP